MLGPLTSAEPVIFLSYPLEKGNPHESVVRKATGLSSV